MAESTFVTFESAESVLIARIVSSNVGERESTIIQEETLARITDGSTRVVMDVGDVRMISSVGLGMLVTVAKRCKQGKGVFALFGFQENLLDLIKLTKLDRVLTIETDEDRAMKAAKR